MSQNVQSSVLSAASNCTALPDDLVTKQLVLFYLFFRRWTGTVAMQRGDFVGAPSDEIAANYGQKRVIDPQELNVFEKLKKRADTILRDTGLPFCKGYAVPVSKAEEVYKALKDVAEEYNAERDRLISNIGQLCQDWSQKNPGCALPTVLAENVSGRINADFSAMSFQPLDTQYDPQQKNQQAKTQVSGGLWQTMLSEVAERASGLLKKSVLNKSAEDLSQRTLNVLKGIESKIESLLFLNTGMQPLQTFVKQLLEEMPTKGRYTEAQFQILKNGLTLLSDIDKLNAIASGQLDLNTMLQALNLSSSVLSTSTPSLAFGTASQPTQPQLSIQPQPQEPCACASSSGDSAELPLEVSNVPEAPDVSEVSKEEKVSEPSQVSSPWDDLEKELALISEGENDFEGDKGAHESADSQTETVAQTESAMESNVSNVSNVSTELSTPVLNATSNVVSMPFMTPF